MRRLTFLLPLAALALASCSTRITPPDYRTSRDSLFYLHQTGARPVSVGDFSGRRLSWINLAQCLRVPSRRTDFVAGDFGYIRNALIEELSIARLYTPSGGAVTLSGQVEWIRLNRVLPFDGRWRIQLRLISSNGRSLAVRHDEEFDFDGLLGPAGCRNAIRAIEPAVRTLIEKAVTHPEFRALLA